MRIHRSVFLLLAAGLAPALLHGQGAAPRYRNDFDRSAWAKVPVPKAWDLYDEALWGCENVIGYLPFVFDVTGKLRADAENFLVVRADNKARLSWLPGARQIEWIHYGGILEPVTLATSAQVFVSGVAIHAVPAGPGAEIACRVEVESVADAEQEVSLRVAVVGRPESLQRAILKVPPGGTATQELALSLKQANPWSPDSPTLYQLAVSAGTGKTSDRLVTRFGVRKIETRRRQILLNGKPFFAKGVNRYDEYGNYGLRPPRELLVADLRRMKAAGVNFIRVHYPQSPDILSLYDEMGFGTIEEVPVNWWGSNFSGQGEEILNDSILDQALPALERMIARDRNHPSVFIWSMCNESQTSTEVGILNVYQGTLSGKPALHKADIDELVRKAAQAFLERQLKAFPDKPLIVTEFGNRGVPGIRGDVVYSEDHQAACIRAFWQAILNARETSGGVLWSWADYYHRRHLIAYAVFGPYGVVTVDRRPKQALKTLSEIYGGKGAAK